MPVIRCKYNKEHRIKYVSHLDMIRTFQRSLRRARLPIAFTAGYNPHPKIAFGPALGVGITSEAEYIDIELEETIEPKRFIQALNAAFPRGLSISKCMYLSKGQKNIMSICEGARYLFKFSNGNINNEEMKKTIMSGLDEIIKKEEIFVTRNTKKGHRKINIRPLIYGIENIVIGTAGLEIEVLLSAGNKGSVRSEEILKILNKFAGTELKLTGVHRKELYISDNGKLVPPFL